MGQASVGKTLAARWFSHKKKTYSWLCPNKNSPPGYVFFFLTLSGNHVFTYQIQGFPPFFS